MELEGVIDIRLESPWKSKLFPPVHIFQFILLKTINQTLSQIAIHGAFRQAFEIPSFHILVSCTALILMLQQFDDRQDPQNHSSLQQDLEISLNLHPQPEWIEQSPPKSHKKVSKATVAAERGSGVAELLRGDLQTSKRRLKKGLSEHISKQLQQLEYKVLVSETTNNQQDYLKALYHHTSPNKYLKNQIHDTLHEAQRDIERDGDFSVQKRRIARNKDELKELERMDHYRLLKIKEGEVKSKVGDLRLQMQAEYFRNKLHQQLKVADIVDQNYFSIDHPRTKQAELFVKELQQKRNDERKHIQYLQLAKHEQLQEQRLREAERKELERQERRTRLEEHYKSKLQERLELKQQQQDKKRQFQEWIRQYQREKPLELQREEEFRAKVLIPELEERHKKLMTIKAEHRPIDNEELAEHQAKYLDFRKDDGIRKRAELEMTQEEDEMRGQELADRLYKGKYRYLILEQMLEEKYPLDGREVEQSKRDRIRAYNEHIRQLQKQEAPALEGQTIGNKKFLRRVRQMNGSLTLSHRNSVSEGQPAERKLSDGNQYQDGIRNLAFLKSMVREQVAKEEDNKPAIHFLEEKEVTKPQGFLEVQRQKNSHKQKEAAVSKEIQQTDVTANEDIDAIKAKAHMLDQRIQRKETQLKNSTHSAPNAEQVEKDYLHAIKAKIHMLSQFD